MADEGLHEIQLNGKQLVFLFMASTVVAVVIFLCGVMVGRGVRAQRVIESTESSADAGLDPTAVAPSSASPRPATAAASSSSSSSSSPASAGETLTYPNRLEGQEPAEETLTDPTAPVATKLSPAPAKPTVIEPPAPAKPNAPNAGRTLSGPNVGRTLSGSPDTPSAKPAPQNSAPAAVASTGTTPARTTASADDAAPSTVAAEPAGNGFVVQVAAVNDRKEAETIARRLAGKGYPSFVTTPGKGTPRMFRVRIGKYKDRREAETVATKLEKEEQFKPWITR